MTLADAMQSGSTAGGGELWRRIADLSRFIPELGVSAPAPIVG